MAIVCVCFAMDTELERIWSDLKLTEEEKEMIAPDRDRPSKNFEEGQ